MPIGFVFRQSKSILSKKSEAEFFEMEGIQSLFDLFGGQARNRLELDTELRFEKRRPSPVTYNEKAASLFSVMYDDGPPVPNGDGTTPNGEDDKSAPPKAQT